MENPTELKYTEDHEWIRMEGDLAIVGITHHAQSELGDIVYVEIDALDETLDQKEAFGTIEAVKTTAELFMPVSGKVVAFNDNLEDKPELVNESPYEDGWIIKIKVSNPEELEGLLSAEAYTEFAG